VAVPLAQSTHRRPVGRYGRRRGGVEVGLAQHREPRVDSRATARRRAWTRDESRQRRVSPPAPGERGSVRDQRRGDGGARRRVRRTAPLCTCRRRVAPRPHRDAHTRARRAGRGGGCRHPKARVRVWRDRRI
jgi:hypothetical protein